MRTKIIPFDIELAKKIQSGEIEGRIVTDSKHINFKVDIIKFDVNNDYAPVVGILTGSLGTQSAHTYSKNGKNMDCRDMWGQCNGYNLLIELPEETPKYEFKVGNKVRVNLPKDVVTKYLILGNYQGKVATIINVEGSYVKVKADGLQPYSFDVDYLIPYEEKHEFKPFDKVLVRDDKDNFWHPDIFSMWHGQFAECIGHDDIEYIIPYEGNEHLVGTTATLR